MRFNLHHCCGAPETRAEVHLKSGHHFSPVCSHLQPEASVDTEEGIEALSPR